MAKWSMWARLELKRYLRQVRRSVDKAEAKPGEVADDISRHVEERIAELKLSRVTRKDVVRLAKEVDFPLKRKSWIRGCLMRLAALPLVFLFGWLVFQVASKYIFEDLFRSFYGKPPAGLQKVGVLLGEDLLKKRTFYKSVARYELGTVTDIVYTNLDGQPGKETGVAGWYSARLFNTDCSVIEKIKYVRSGNPNVDFVDIDNDGVCELYDRGGSLESPALINHKGMIVWIRDREEYGRTDEMTAGDIDGDGVSEFAVGYRGSGGIELLDAKGERIWHQDGGNIRSVEIVDTDGDGKKEIVHSHANGLMHIRDAKGKLLATKKTNARFSRFSICNWPGSTGKPHAILANDTRVSFYNFNGEEVGNIQMPECSAKISGLARETVVYLRLSDKYPEVMALAISFSVGDRALLLLLDSKGERIYAEVLPELCKALGVIPDPETGYEKLLVGGEDRVWEYTLKR